MMALGKIFKNFGSATSLGGKPTPLPEFRELTAPPQRQGAYMYFVDSAANILNISKPSAKQYVAQRTLPYDYAGTIPAFEDNNALKRADNNAEALEHFLRNEKNKSLLDKAVFLLSQTQDGRRLLRLAKESDYKIVFDTDYMEKEGAVGIHDGDKKLISLKEGLTVEDVALTLKHELQHMDDTLRGAHYSHQDTLTSATIMQRALEANARLSEAVLAIELYLGDKNGPEEQYKSAAIFKRLYEKHPEIADIAFKHAQDPNARPFEEVAQDIFTAYWNKNDTLNFYDDHLIKMYADRVIPHVDAIKDLRNPNTQKPKNEILSADNNIKVELQRLEVLASKPNWESDEAVASLQNIITIRGERFLSIIDLTSPERTSLSEDATVELKKLIQEIGTVSENLQTEKETSLFATTRPQTPEAKFTSPFDYAQNPHSKFEPLQLPHKMDSADYLTNGETVSEAVTRNFNHIYVSAQQAPVSKVERVNIALSELCDRRHQNVRGHISDLIEAGLRAPIAALPSEYIKYLSNRINNHSEDGLIDLSLEDLKLFEHWRNMAQNGYHPVYGCAYVDFDKNPSKYEDEAQDYTSNSKPYVESYGLEKFIDHMRPTETVKVFENAPILTA